MWIGFLAMVAAVMLARASGDTETHKLVSYGAVGYLCAALVLRIATRPQLLGVLIDEFRTGRRLAARLDAMAEARKRH